MEKDQNNTTDSSDETSDVEKPMNTKNLSSDIVDSDDTDGFDTIVFHLPGEGNPIIFKGEKRILIGRFNATTGPQRFLDLTPYRGAALGVSRQHAEIWLQEGDFYIRDLNSLNGTFINGRRLKTDESRSIQSGDQIQFAQLLLVVFLKSSTEDKPEQQTITEPEFFLLKDPQGELVKSSQISYSNFIIAVIPYLKTISSIHETLQPESSYVMSDIKYIKNFQAREDEIYIEMPEIGYLVSVLHKWIYKPRNIETRTLLDSLSDLPTIMQQIIDTLFEYHSIEFADEKEKEITTDRLTRYILIIWASKFELAVAPSSTGVS